ncbi:MAG: protein-disulfide reductase DsbD domain-containing protein, partial [Candidatus Margulisiibacteriota bacterium]
MIKWLLLFAITLFTHANNQINWEVVGQRANGQIQTKITQTLPDGWHSYWKNPGDSGEKASISNPSQGIKLGELHFPEPKVIPLDPFITYG